MAAKLLSFTLLALATTNAECGWFSPSPAPSSSEDVSVDDAASAVRKSAGEFGSALLTLGKQAADTATQSAAPLADAALTRGVDATKKFAEAAGTAAKSAAPLADAALTRGLDATKRLTGTQSEHEARAEARENLKIFLTVEAGFDQGSIDSVEHAGVLSMDDLVVIESMEDIERMELDLNMVRSKRLLESIEAYKTPGWAGTVGKKAAKYAGLSVLNPGVAAASMAYDGVASLWSL